MKLTVNGIPREVEADPDMPLLWLLRDLLGVTGPKYGCGVGACGSCMVHVDGKPVRACTFSARDAGDADILTIEGLAQPDGRLHPVQQAWLDHQAAQCGYCQPGRIMAAVARAVGRRH